MLAAMTGQLMTAKILIANKVGGLGDIIGVVGVEHSFSKNETLDSWIDNGGDFDSWVAKFAVITVTDKSVDDLDFLLAPLLSGEGVPMEGGAYYFAVPDESTEEYHELYYTGGVVAQWDKVSEYMRTR